MMIILCAAAVLACWACYWFGVFDGERESDSNLIEALEDLLNAEDEFYAKGFTEYRLEKLFAAQKRARDLLGAGERKAEA